MSPMHSHDFPSVATESLPVIAVSSAGDAFIRAEEAQEDGEPAKKIKKEAAGETQLHKWQSLHPELNCFSLKVNDNQKAVALCECKVEVRLKLDALLRHTTSTVHVNRTTNLAKKMIKAMATPILKRAVILVHAALLCLRIGAAQKNVDKVIEAFTSYGAAPGDSWRSLGYSWEFVDSAAAVAKKTLTERVSQSPVHYLNFDLSTDLGTKKRLAVIVGYYDMEAGSTRQRLVGFCDTTGTGEDIAACITELYTSLNMNPSSCCGATTDGGGPEKKAFDLLVERKFFGNPASPLAAPKWTHCLAHRVSLSIEDSWASNEFCKTAEYLFTTIYAEFNRSAPRVEQLAELHRQICDIDVDEDRPTEVSSGDAPGIRRFIKFYKIRWLSKAACLGPILHNAPALLCYYSENPDRSPNHLNYLRDPHGTGPLVQLWKVLMKIIDYVIPLQGEKVTGSEGMRYIDGIEASLTMMLSELSGDVLSFTKSVIRRLSVRIPHEERKQVIDENALSDPLVIVGCKGLSIGSKSDEKTRRFILRCRDSHARLGSLSVSDIVKFAMDPDAGDTEIAGRVTRGLVNSPTSCGAERAFSVLSRQLNSSRNRLKGTHLESSMLLAGNVEILDSMLKGGSDVSLADVAEEWMRRKNRRERLSASGPGATGCEPSR